MRVERLLLQKENLYCKCPDVIYQLESTADRPVGYQRTDRKVLLVTLCNGIMNKAFTSPVKAKPLAHYSRQW